MDILKYISFSFLENICQKSRSAYRGKTQKFKIGSSITNSLIFNPFYRLLYTKLQSSRNTSFPENLFNVAVGSAAKMTVLTDIPRKGHPPCRFYASILNSLAN